MNGVWRNRFRFACLGATVLLVAIAIVAPRAAAAGWLVGFASIAAVVLGAVALILIHVLTGGAWGAFARPSLLAAASATPLLLIAFVVLLVGAPVVYPWIQHPDSAGSGVAGLYLNFVFFAVRGIVLIVGLALLMLLGGRSGLGRLAAGIGLIWYCVGLDLVAVDWLQSVEPRYTSSAFGAQIIVDELVAALAWTILTTPVLDEDGEESERWNDLGSLLLATTLGETYLILMTLIVHWYGDQPHQAAWYVARTAYGWWWLELVGFLIGSAGPLLALLFEPVRRSGGSLKVVAAASLAGVLIENIWLVAPSTSRWAILTGPLAVIAMSGFASSFWRRTRPVSLQLRSVR